MICVVTGLLRWESGVHCTFSDRKTIEMHKKIIQLKQWPVSHPQAYPLGLMDPNQ